MSFAPQRPPPDSPATIAPGHYAQKQLGCDSTIIAFSHASRFRTAIALAGSHPDATLLDYGSGDGTFIGFVSGAFKACVGAEITPDQIDDCRTRFAQVPSARFCHVRELVAPEHAAAYRVVVCMEVLEHCLDHAVDEVLFNLGRVVASNGTVIISVPIETGPSFLLKYAVRTVAGWRNLSDYRGYEKYSLRTAARMISATAGTTIDRPAYGEPGSEFHSHYGFNWRRLRDRIAQSFDIERTLYSPFNLPGGCLDSQVWFVCHPRVR